MLYGERKIQEIIDAIKANKKIKWKDTIIVITSDNGAAPGVSTRGPNYGSPLPFRGQKSYFNIHLCAPILIAPKQVHRMKAE